MGVENLAVIDKDELSPAMSKALTEAVTSAEVKASFGDIINTALRPTPKVEQNATATAVASLEKVTIFGVPLGEAALGGTSALVVNEVVDLIAGKTGLKAAVPYANAVIEGFSAYACHRWLGRFIGQKGADVAAVLLTWDAINELINIRGYIRGAIPGFSATEFGARKMVGNEVPSLSPARNPIVQNRAVDYYAVAFGRS